MHAAVGLIVSNVPLFCHPSPNYRLSCLEIEQMCGSWRAGGVRWQAGEEEPIA